eukprot:2841071-Prymnesium_polylepis.2
MSALGFCRWVPMPNRSSDPLFVKAGTPGGDSCDRTLLFDLRSLILKLSSGEFGVSSSLKLSSRLKCGANSASSFEVQVDIRRPDNCFLATKATLSRRFNVMLVTVAGASTLLHTIACWSRGWPA